MPTLSSARRDAILQSVDAAFEAQLQFTEALVRFPSTRGQEGTCQDFLFEAYRARGYSVDRWRIEPDDIAHHPGFSRSPTITIRPLTWSQPTGLGSRSGGP